MSQLLDKHDTRSLPLPPRRCRLARRLQPGFWSGDGDAARCPEMRRGIGCGAARCLERETSRLCSNWDWTRDPSWFLESWLRLQDASLHRELPGNAKTPQRVEKAGEPQPVVATHCGDWT